MGVLDRLVLNDQAGDRYRPLGQVHISLELRLGQVNTAGDEGAERRFIVLSLGEVAIVCGRGRPSFQEVLT